MYHYLFTNDLRISTLDNSLQNAGHCFVTGTVPTATENKSANNNMKTLGFYFNLTEDSICAKQAKEGNIRAVVFNFIKKFQFPNLRTEECLDNCINDGITLAPMRVIIKVLYTMNLFYGSATAYLTRDEIKYFIFYNDEVAKTRHIDFIRLINDIVQYRNNGQYPEYISTKDSEHEWKQEDRQIREMVKVLKWSGCVVESEEKITITNEGLSQENKAAIYDIINYSGFWNGNTLESYRQYMDMDDNLIDESDEPVDSNNEEVERITGGENILYYGVPGSGKSYAISKICSDERYMERVVFHPDYTYSDFVGQILPRLDENNKLEYIFTAGPFTRVLQKASDDPSNMYYLIVEEINRGNAPAIFGEIFQLLDRNEDGASEYGISNYEVAKEVYGNTNHSVKIPSNLTVLATMNTSDQNVFTLDTAFQRRWKMKHIEVIYNVSKRGKIDWNRTIKTQKPSIQDGQAFYLDFVTKRNSINENELITLIHEYCVFDSFEKIGWLFTDKLPSKPRLKFNYKLFKSVIREKLERTFNDKNKKLFRNMLAIIDYEGENNEQREYKYGTNRFEYVWESMIDRVFGIEKKEQYFPKTTWTLSERKYDNASLEPDTIMIVNNDVYVLDAKYYKYGVTRRPWDLPESTSINKQITYGEYIAEETKFKKIHGENFKTYNAFLMPYNMEDWKATRIIGFRMI